MDGGDALKKILRRRARLACIPAPLMSIHALTDLTDWMDGLCGAVARARAAVGGGNEVTAAAAALKIVRSVFFLVL